jgi:hypothetical protein
MRWLAALLLSATPALATTGDDLRAEGYRDLTCSFDQRCVMGQPCGRAWREVLWLINPDKGRAFRIRADGQVRRAAELRLDARWGKTSKALSILSPMREAVTSHLTVFDGGGAILSMQYAGAPGSGQFFTGTCEVENTE